jgi:Ca2+-binding EF-hand superfamily protein
MIRSLAFLSSAIAAVALARFSPADEPETKSGVLDAEKLFSRLDANGDGQLAFDEVNEQHRRLYQRLVRRNDADGNGSLSLAEFKDGLNEAPPETPADEPRGPGERNEQLARFLQADPNELFKQLDADGDGKLVLEELPGQSRPQFAQFFQRADVDRDKELSPDEFRKGHEQLRQFLGAAGPGQTPRPVQGTRPVPGAGGQAMPPGRKLYVTLDLDGDGSLSADEIAKASESLKKLDLDGDGTVSRRELAGPGQAAPGNAPGNAPAAGAPNAQRILVRLPQLDKDGDGKLSREEAPPFVKQRFDQFDANGDGFVEPDELRRIAAGGSRQ